jgi:hypothetical protein
MYPETKRVLSENAAARSDTPGKFSEEKFFQEVTAVLYGFIYDNPWVVSTSRTESLLLKEKSIIVLPLMDVEGVPPKRPNERANSKTDIMAIFFIIW